MTLETAGFSGVASIPIAVGIASWYLFGKENVVRYYNELERRADAAEKMQLDATNSAGLSAPPLARSRVP